MTIHPNPSQPDRTGPTAGFSLVEFLMAAFILGVGLLGLGAMQTATVRGRAGAGIRLAAAALAANSLELIQAEAGHLSRVRRGQEPPGPRPLRYAGPGAGPWVDRFGRDGRPGDARSAFFTVTVTRSVPALRDAPEGPLPAWVFRATVTWAEGPSRTAAGLSLARLVAY